MKLINQRWDLGETPIGIQVGSDPRTQHTNLVHINTRHRVHEHPFGRGVMDVPDLAGDLLDFADHRLRLIHRHTPVRQGEGNMGVGRFQTRTR
ncbi:hypothetical protein NQ038_08600 [Brevibacterium sp. 50QC2O2]|nr:hypothetical protein [Brevibacterium sp. 50QC2O2]MCQ9388705.1 hypothetical protein [Brevibacterium sp. 50QC2O2]